MTPDDLTSPIAQEGLVLGDLSLTVDDLNGHSVDQLTDYYDAGFTPADPSIDSSVGCQMALAAIGRLRALTNKVIEDGARALPPLDESWLAGILEQISVQVQPGRDIPLDLIGDEGRVVITEGAVRGIIRSAGDQIPGLLVGRVSLIGDVTRADEPIAVSVDATAIWGYHILDSAEQLKQAIDREVRTHTYLNVISIDVNVHDVHRATS